MFDTRSSVVQLSRGATWNPAPADRPYLIAEVGNPWPADATATCLFTDTSGGELLTVTGTVTPDAITFTAPPSDVDPIGNGCNFEIFLTTTGGDIYKIRYGKAVRMEAPLTNAPATVISNQALRFVDNFPTLGLRSNWKAIAGRTKIYDNSSSSLPNSVGPDFSLFFQQSAIRWDTPLNGDSVRVSVNLLNQSDGKTNVIVCADQRFTTFLTVQFEEVGISNIHRVHLGVGSGPFTIAYQGSPVTNTVADGDNYTIGYSDATKTIAVYKGTSTTPLTSWPDSGNLVPHGPGYRYAGFSWDNGGLFPGIQASYWAAKDDV